MKSNLEDVRKRAIYSAHKFGFGELAEDIAQEVVLDFLEGRSESSTVDQVAIDVIRRRFGRPGTPNFESRKSLRLAQSIVTEDGEETIGACDSELAGMRGDIERGLRCLSPVERLIFELSHIFGMKQKEVADELGVTESRVSQRLTQIESKLRMTMNREPDEFIGRMNMEGKCKRPDCQNQAVRGMAYCSQSCAPLGNYGLGNTRSDTTVRSSSRAPTGLSVGSFEEEDFRRSGIKDANPIPDSKSARPSSSVSNTPPILKEKERNYVSATPISQPRSESANSNHGWRDDEEMQKLNELQSETGTPGTQSISVRKSSSAVEGEILPSDSLALSTRLEEETLASVNLINDTANHLYGVMKSFGKAARSQEDVVTYSPQQINAICNLGKNITNALRLKLDISKGLKNGR